MDLKQVQNEMKSCILLHQTVLRQLKNDPKNSTLKQKLTNIQITIGKLGKKQKEIIKHNTQNCTDVSKTQTQQDKSLPLNLSSKPSKNSPAHVKPTVTKSKEIVTLANNTQKPSLPVVTNGGTSQLNKNLDGNALFRILQKQQEAVGDGRKKTVPIIIQKSSSSIYVHSSSVPSTSKTFIDIRPKLTEVGDRPDAAPQPSAFTRSGSYQNYRIQDGKTFRTIVPGDGKPRNDALKEVLAQAKSVVPQKSQISFQQQVPKKQPVVDGFVPITHATGNRNHSIAPKAVPFTNRQSRPSRPTSAPLSKTKVEESSKSKENAELYKMQQSEYLRNLNLVPVEVAKSMANRRFSKRKITANPVYSGGIYVAHNDMKRTPSPYLETPDSEIMAPPKNKKLRPKPRRSDSEMEVKMLAQNYEELKRMMHNTTDGGKTSPRKQESTNVENGKTKRKHRGQKSNSEHQDGHEDQCTVCHQAGEVLMCDTCSLVYHLKCCKPPLKQVPTGMWVCSKCKNQFKSTVCGLPWTNVTDVVHAYHVHHRKQQEQLNELKEEISRQKARKVSLEQQTKNLTHQIKENVCLRSKAIREGKVIKDRLKEMSAVVRYLNKRTQEQDGGVNKSHS